MIATTRRNLLRCTLAVLVIGAAARPAAAQDFSCTEVLGFSQSWEWFTGRSLSVFRGNITVEPADFLAGWQGRFQFGSSVELWTAADFAGWRVVAAAHDRVSAGPSPALTNCSQYADGLGHLAPDGAAEVHATLVKHFSR
jgi:hypothetical protein